ncbi:MAG TPA: CAP domain-containing protein [Solirubrobacteraceae bacterium]
MARTRLTLLAALTICLCFCSAAAARADSCADANLTPRAGNLERVRGAVLCLINQERAAHGESALQDNAKLEQAAQRHTEDMAFGDYFDHVGPRGDTPLDRMRASGYIYNSHLGYDVGENIAWGTLWLATPRAIVNAWMASPEHRANILDRHYRDTAIGVSTHPPASLAHGQAGAIYTQDFGVLIAGRTARHRRAASTGRARVRPRASRYNLRPLTTKRRRKGYGSTRRQVRHRHGVGARHRSRHRRAVRGAGRAGPHQRSRR